MTSQSLQMPSHHGLGLQHINLEGDTNSLYQIDRKEDWKLHLVA